MSIDQLQSRIDSANNSLEGIEQEQSRSGNAHAVRHYICTQRHAEQLEKSAGCRSES